MKVVYCLVLLVLIFPGCLRVSGPGTLFAPQPVGDNYAVLYIVRENKLVGSGMAADIFVNTKPVGTLVGKSYLALYLRPGGYRIRASIGDLDTLDQFPEASLWYHVKAGKEYYLEYEMDRGAAYFVGGMSYGGWSAKFIPIDDPSEIDGLKSLKLNNADPEIGLTISSKSMW
ncbi:MAG: DUF2846 domain-containing protein [Opitutales bacterium]